MSFGWCLWFGIGELRSNPLERAVPTRVVVVGSFETGREHRVKPLPDRFHLRRERLGAVIILVDFGGRTFVGSLIGT